MSGVHSRAIIRRAATRAAAGLGAAVAVGALGCGADAEPGESPAATPSTVLMAAGDIAGCDTDGDEATAGLLAQERPDVVAVLGDNAYEYGTEKQYRDCYEPNWGRFKARTRPAAGNHEFADERASGFFTYFGSAAGRPGEGWYSYDLPGWHVVVLNSMCVVVGCGPGSAQLRWLERDLRGDRSRCTIAYWHHPRFSSGSKHGDDPRVRYLWGALERDGADLVLSAHDHSYERFGPLDPEGEPDPDGMPEIVVGTGGRSLRPFGEIRPGSVARDAERFGVLKLTLRAGRYDWRFMTVAGSRVSDAGSARCR